MDQAAPEKFVLKSNCLPTYYNHWLNLVSKKEILNEGMPSVENRISHRSLGKSHYTTKTNDVRYFTKDIPRVFYKWQHPKSAISQAATS